MNDIPPTMNYFKYKASFQIQSFLTTVHSQSWIYMMVKFTGAYQVVLVVKNPHANAGDVRDMDGFNPWVRKIPWRRAQQPFPVFLPGESHGQRRLAGKPTESQRVRHNWSNLARKHAKFTDLKLSSCLDLKNWTFIYETVPRTVFEK